MKARGFFRCIAVFGLTGVLGACQQSNTGDQQAPSNIPVGIERFLLFPNPIGPAGGFETDSDAYPSAYYRAIDPNNDKDTLAKWKAQNGFSDTSTPLPGTEHLLVFRDTKDLGYGRRMTGRRNSGTGEQDVAFFVENYSVTSGSSSDYSNTLNVEAAIVRDTRWHVGTNAIEWSSAPCGAEDPVGCSSTARFLKFYNFNPAGVRQTRVNLDGKGLKAMPGPCISCHGGRADPLTPGAIGAERFAFSENSLSRKRGDTQARLQGMNVDSFAFSPQPGWTKAEQQLKLKDFNQWMLCTYPGSGTITSNLGRWGNCTQQAAGVNEWQGTATAMIQDWYGGAAMPNDTFADTYVPAPWNTVADGPVYTQVVAPYCRTCHILRGTANQSDIDFMTPAKFAGWADRIKAHVFDRGNMPLALIVYRDFWESSAPQTLANYINPLLLALNPPDTAISANGEALKPGRPIAGPGPNRMVRTGVNATLSAGDSLFATSFTWELDPPGQNATITPTADPKVATFFSSVSSVTPYTVRLTVGNGTITDSKVVNVTVDNAFPDPATLTFATHIKPLLQLQVAPGVFLCGASCHMSTSPAPSTPPVFFSDLDRNGDGMVGDLTDDAWFLKAVRGRANMTDTAASAFLRKPSGNHHAGGTPLNVGTAGGLTGYSILYNWILLGMP